MRTYPISVIREAFHQVIDTNKTVRFSYYIPKGRPIRVKGKILSIFAKGSNGWYITLDKVRVNRKMFRSGFGFYINRIRWISDPFDWNKIGRLCDLLTKKIGSPTDGKQDRCQ